MKIQVSTSKWNDLQCVLSKQDFEHLTKSESNFKVVTMSDLRMDTLVSTSKYAKYNRIFGFRPTGWTYQSRSSKALHLPKLLQKRSTANATVYSVPYSEHSSFTELCACINDLHPAMVIPTVHSRWDFKK